jgi:hypothetical protein
MQEGPRGRWNLLLRAIASLPAPTRAAASGSPLDAVIELPSRLIDMGCAGGPARKDMPEDMPEGPYHDEVFL